MYSTYLAIGRVVGEESGIYKISYPTGAYQLLFQSSVYSETPGISTYGTVAFANVPGSMDSIRDDGTGLTAINFTGGITGYFPRYSIDGTNRLAFTDGANLYVGPGTGGTATKIQTNDIPQGEAWNPSGTQIMYSAQVGTAGNCDLFVTSTTGGSTTDVTPTALKNTGTLDNPSWSPDGVSIVAMYSANGASTFELVRFNVNDPANYTDITPSGYYEQLPIFSPDGTKIAFYRDAVDSQTAGVYVEDSLGLNAGLLAPDPANNVDDGYFGLAWSPFLPKETVVSATASTFYHKAASGFLLSQNSDQFGSFVAFTANTPTDAAIQAPTSNGEYAPMIFTITADSITEIGYINNYFNLGTTISLTSTPMVIVSIDAETGRVDTMAPAATAKPALSKNADGTVTYSGSFKAIYDGKGRNLAPSGASRLVMNPKTGQLVSFK